MALLTKMSSVPTPETFPFFEAGGSTFHKHRCPGNSFGGSADQEPHDWLCNSPYCETLQDPCPDHGGQDPVKKGREPWRR